MAKYITDHIKAVVFDFDDTLIATYPAIRELHKYIAKTYYNIDLTEEEIIRHWGLPIAELARHYYKTEDIPDAITKMILHQPDFPKQPFRHTKTVLEQLKQKGLLLGIVSAIILPILERDAQYTGVPLGMVDYVQTAEDTIYHKPDPKVFEPLLNWVNQKGLTARQVLYIGDGLHDYTAAVGAGLNFIGVTTGLVVTEEFTVRGVTSIKQLIELVEG